MGMETRGNGGRWGWLAHYFSTEEEAETEPHTVQALNEAQVTQGNDVIRAAKQPMRQFAKSLQAAKLQHELRFFGKIAR